ncbi:NAD(+) synthase [Patescibacteria group bacterium]|nr:NAD(+) synthase [Patescibacteria group bacterium]MBU1967432.1 NAD(+) synthase [Patescibacteria group bacterium]MBU2543781.1 NAD(+) synthase [Patescibacteria group bacterium]
MSLQLPNPQQTVNEIVSFLQQTYTAVQKTQAVIAVSGGIDSALSLTLVVRALSAQNVIAVAMPYGDQDIADSKMILEFNQIPQENWQVINIKSVVDAAAEIVGIGTEDKIRLGNLMARTRMMMIYDLAKKHDALVCGTENKSEKYLGYFTRFGDEASDVEPIVGLYKTQVHQLAEFLNLPLKIRLKPPTAELWDGQTDEAELGFTYEVADQVLEQLIAGTEITGIEPELVKKVVERIEEMEFKQRVPYTLNK